MLIDEYGAPRLADFGQARFVDMDVTRSGDITATLGYAAPEVIQGRPATPGADVYSLAATVMALILGRAPFDAEGDESVAPVLYRVLSEPPPDLRLLGVPDPVAAVFDAALAKDPAHRPDSAIGLGVALQRAQLALGLPVSPLAVAGQPPLLPPGSDGGPTQVSRAGPPPQLPRAAAGGSQQTSQAGQPGSLQPSPVGSPAGPTRVGTVPYARERPSPGQAGQPPPGLPAFAHAAATPAAKPRRLRWGWVLLSAVLVAALAAGGVFAVRALNEPEPRQNVVALDLLLGPADLSGDGWELDTDVTGTLSKVFDDSTLLPCLGLPVIPDDGEDPGALDVRDLRTSGVYVVPGISVQTAGVITSSEAQAGDVVESLGPPGFDLCLDEFTSLARSLSLSGDSVDYNVPPALSEPALPVLADVVVGSSRRIDVPLAGSDTGAESFVIDYVFLAAGSSVACLGIWNYDGPVDTGLRDAAIAMLVGKLTE
ncbi:MAG: serine/threonine protein kinase [Geodermatophilaceae bacterium]